MNQEQQYTWFCLSCDQEFLGGDTSPTKCGKCGRKTIGTKTSLWKLTTTKMNLKKGKIMSLDQKIGGRTRGCPFVQWEFEISNVVGETPAWTEEEIAVINEVLDRKITAWQQPNSHRGFKWWDNAWTLTKQQRSDGPFFMATKENWRSGSLSGKTTEELSRSIDDYWKEG